MSLASLPSLHVKIEKDLLKLKTHLQDDDVKKFTKLMGQTGGHEKTGTVRNTMTRIISNEVRMGQEGKKKV